MRYASQADKANQTDTSTDFMEDHTEIPKTVCYSNKPYKEMCDTSNRERFENKKISEQMRFAKRYQKNHSKRRK